MPTFLLYHKQNEYSIEKMQIYAEYFQGWQKFCIFIHIYTACVNARRKDVWRLGVVDF